MIQVYYIPNPGKKERKIMFHLAGILCSIYYSMDRIKNVSFQECFASDKEKTTFQSFFVSLFIILTFKKKKFADLLNIGI